jgi:hypothetical protein
MSFNEATLPLQINSYQDESGIGFCLRAISGNGADLHALRRLIGVRDKGRITSRQAKVLGRVFHQSPDWFENSLPSSEKNKPFQIDFFGHRWFSKNCLRISNPQVCVQCIHTKGYCRAIWDVSLATVCLEHQSRLSDCCEQCRQPIRWDRPRLDYGHCGHLFRTPKEEEIPASIFDLQELLEWKFFPSPNLTLKNDYLSSFNELSLSAIHTLILSFGLRRKPLEVLHSTVRRKAFRCDEWINIVERGLERLYVLHKGECDLTQISQLISENLLEHLAFNHDSIQDQQHAIALLEKFFNFRVDPRVGTRLGQLSQLKLF